MKNLQILILGAGRGSRMKPLTDSQPKPLLQLYQENILERLIKQIYENFVNFDLYVNISYLALEIAGFITQLPLEMRPRLIWEETPSGSAVTVIRFASSIESSATLVIHGDLVLSNFGVQELAKFFTHDSASTVVAHRRKRSQARSILQTSGSAVDSNIEIKREQVPLIGDDSVLVNSGIYYLRTEDLRQLKLPAIGTDVSPFLIDELISKELLQYREWEWPRISIDSHEAYLAGITLSTEDPIGWPE
jgi:NDP-sugar pyrophosphorylase family protein